MGIQTAGQALISVLIIAVATFLTRALPFLIFPGSKPVPQYIEYLGKVLPFAIIGMLVVYCLKGIAFTFAASWLPEFLTILYIVIIHHKKHNLILSIGGGTLLYMVLIQLVFK